MVFSIEGFDELAAAFASWADRLESDAGPNIVQRCLDIAESIAVQDVPVDTGTLRDSIHQEIVSDLVGQLVADTDYAGYVEFGTSKMGAQPYMQPAADEVEQNIQDITIEEIQNALG
jgi:HK97 gp10 family phage protein